MMRRKQKWRATFKAGANVTTLDRRQWDGKYDLIIEHISADNSHEARVIAFKLADKRIENPYMDTLEEMMSPIGPNTVDMDRHRAISAGVEIPTASAEVLKRIGVSRRRWNNMTLVEQIAALQARVERDEDKTGMLASMPPEPIGLPEQDAPVVWFVKYWGGTERYEYVAISTPKGWLVSGQNKTAPKTWTELLQFALLRENKDFDPYFHVANDWKHMGRSDNS